MSDTTLKISKSKIKFGSQVDKGSTVFNIFAINADKVSVAIYEKWNSVRRELYPMHEVEDNIWHITIDEDLSSKFYAYIVHRDGENYIATDPYSYSLSMNGAKSAVIDLKLTSSKGFDNHKKPNLSYKEAIIYETHIRDFTSSTTIDVDYKNKYLGMKNSSTLETGEKIGFNHLKELGITHVHLLPVLDFVTVDEEDKNGYNWGYDPDSFFSLEGSYATKPDDPYSRIREFKGMVMHYHKSGIGVILDVVYNHTYHGNYSNFQVLAPNVFYRMEKDGRLSDGSGCGNEINTEDPLVRRVICESLKHLLTTYKVDGFRFDLLGLMDRMTMYSLVKELRKIDPNVVLYGEPWVGGHSVLPHNKRVYKGTQRNRGFSLFNDDYRNAIKGDNDGSDKGYIQGNTDQMEKVKEGISGTLFDNGKFGFTGHPYESVNYTCSHDNLIIYDKISKSIPGITHEDNIRVNMLGFFLTIMSFGTPFIHEGTEFARSKHMDHNSYRSGDYVNGIDWSLKHDNDMLFNYVKKLIKLRKSMGFLTRYSKDEIKKNLSFYNLTDGGIGYQVYDDSDEITYAFFINPNEQPIQTLFERCDFSRVLCDGMRKREYSIKETDKELLVIPPRTAMILIKS